MKKRIISLVLALAMLAALGVTSFAAPVTRSLVGIPTNTKVSIVTKANEYYHLNIYANSPASGKNVTVYHDTNSEYTQRWQIVTLDSTKSLYKVLVNGYSNLSLNVYRAGNPYNCTVFSVSNNSYNDYAIKIIDEDNNPFVANKFGFVIPDAVLCMTTAGTSDGSNVSWSSPVNTNSQYWNINRE